MSRSRYDGMSFQQRDCLSCRSCPCPPPPGGPSEGTGKQQYQSGCVPRYCDILDAGVEGNPEMLQDIIKDMQCVLEKLFGNSKNMEGRNKGLLSKIAALKEELGKLEECKALLQKELCRIQGELITAQKAYEDEVDQRLCLEEVNSQLRQRLSRLEAAAEIDAKEKDELAACILEMERRLKDAYDMIECLKDENAKLLAKLRELEDWKSRQGNNNKLNKGLCSQLEEALAKCCKANEELQRELAALRKERDDLQQCIENLKKELKRLCDEFERERKEWAQRRAAYEKTIAELKQALDAQTLKNQQMCEKLHRALTEHHTEMEKMKSSAQSFCNSYNQEKAAREELEKKLRECEERNLNSGSFRGAEPSSYSCGNFRPGCRPCETNNFTCS